MFFCGYNMTRNLSCISTGRYNSMFHVPGSRESGSEWGKGSEWGGGLSGERGSECGRGPEVK